MSNPKWANRAFIFSIGLLFSTAITTAQQQWQDILSKSNNFNEIVDHAQQFFQGAHTERSLGATGSGEEEADGDFVKFMRWKTYWQDLLQPDGSLGDPTTYWRSQLAARADPASLTGPYRNITWSNISHHDYLEGQIGMGRTTSMAFHPIDPKTFYVGSALGGIWKTTDGGTSYTPLGDQLPYMAVSSIVVDQANPNVLYIALSDHIPNGTPAIGVYKSIDGGQHWLPTSLQFETGEKVNIYRMVAASDNSSKIFVATSVGLYRTDDGFSTDTAPVKTYGCTE